MLGYLQVILVSPKVSQHKMLPKDIYGAIYSTVNSSDAA